MWVQSLGQENILREEIQLTPVFLPGKFHGQRSLAGYSPSGSQRVGHDQGIEHTHILTHTYTHTHTKKKSLEKEITNTKKGNHKGSSKILAVFKSGSEG